MRLFMEPATGVYRLSLNQANLKLYPILKSLGVDDATLEKAWGREVLAGNQEAWDKSATEEHKGDEENRPKSNAGNFRI